MKTLYFSSLLLIFCLGTLNSQTKWKIDVTHSKVQFSVKHLVISEVIGHFSEFDAELVQTKEDFSKSILTATIKTSSIDTDNQKRDEHLRSADFFDVENFPEMTFVSKSFEKSGKNKYKVTGNLTMRGVTKKVVLNVQYNGQMTNAWGNVVAGFKATATINRKDFNLVWNKTLETGGLLIGENVDILIIVEMQKQTE